MINVNPGETVNDEFLQDEEMNVFSTGVANGTIVDKDGWVYVSKGGILNNTFINNGGEVDLLASGSANATQIKTDGALYVDANAVASGTIVEGGVFVINSKGIASDTTVNGPGQMYVSSAGKIKGTTTVNDGGFLTLEWDSIHSSAIIHGGKLTVLGGPADGDMAFLQNFTVDSGGSLTVSGSAQVSSGTIADGWAKVTSNGILEKVTLNAATVEVKNGALLSNAKLKTGAFVNVASGGIIRDLAVSKGAVLTGVLRDVSELHFDGGTLDLNISGIAPGGEFLIGDDAYTYISGSSYNCTLTVDSSAQPTGVYELIEDATGFDKTITVKDTLGTTLGTLMLGGDPLVYGPLSYTLSIDTTGLLSVTVAAGGATPDITGDLYATFDLTAGMVGSSVNILDGGRLVVMNDGFASQTTIQSNGDLAVSAGGSADVVTVNFGGDLFVRDGGTATLVKENGGYVYIDGGSTVTFVPNSFGGHSYNNTDDWATLHSGTTGTDLTAANGGHIEVYSGGIAHNITIGADGVLNLMEGGTADGMNVKDSGKLNVSNGGRITGKMTFETGATVKAYTGAIVDFDLTQTTTADPALVNNLALVMAEKFSYTLTVDGTEAAGDYKLAEGATGFDKTITVKDTLGTTLGTISVGDGTKTIDGKDYTLTLTGTGSLGVTVAAGGGTPVDLTGDLYATFELTAGMVGSKVNILDGGILNVLNGGFTSQTTVNSNGDLVVSGSADIVTVNFGGDLFVRNGGIATLVMENGGYAGVNDGATVTFVPNSFTGYVYEKVDDWATLHSGTTGTDLSVASAAKILVFSSGFAGNTTVNFGGTLVVSTGGTADGMNVKDSGKLNVSNGGRITGKMTFETGATVTAETGAILDFDLTQTTPGAAALVNDLSFALSQPFSYTITVDGTEAEGDYKLAEGAAGFDKTITVKNTLGSTLGTLTVAGGTTTIGGRDYTLTLTGGILGLTLADGGTPVDLTGDLNSSYDLETGKYASSVNILYGGKLYVSNGALASQTAITSGGKLYVSGGGAATGVTADSGGSGFIYSGGTATGIVADEGAYFYIQLDSTTYAQGTCGGSPFEFTAHLADCTIPSIFNLKVLDGGTADNVTVEGWLTICDGTKATGVSVVSGGGFTVESGGTATGIVAAEGAELLYFYVAPNTYAQGTYGGSAFEITDTVTGYAVHSGGALQVCDGCKADAVTVDYDGFLCVNPGGTATSVMENGGEILIWDGATVTFVPHEFTGVHVKSQFHSATVHSGTTATDTTVSEDGELHVFSGGIAKNTTVNADGFVCLFGGIASDTTVNENGNVYVYVGGTADGVTVHKDGAYLYVESGGKLTGKVTIETGANVTVEDGAIVDFDLTKTTTADPALVNDLSFFGTAAVTYTITVDGTEADGDYKLAEGATGFDKTITVKDTLGATLGTLTVAGGKTTIGGKDYTLTLTGTGSLGVTVAGGGITPDITGDLDTTFDLTAGMVGSSVNILDGGRLNVSNGGFASNTTVDSGGYFFVSSGGKVTDTTLNGLATLFAWMTVLDGGVASNTTVNTFGHFTVSSGASVNHTTVNAGYFFLSSGGVATETTLNAGVVLAEIEGVADGVTVNETANVYIKDKGIVRNATLVSGGRINISAGGKLTGSMSLGGSVSAYEGGIVDFDISALAPGNTAILDNLWMVDGTPTYTLTVSDTQADGKYYLTSHTGYGYGFKDTTAFTVVNTLGTALGTLTVGDGTTDIGGVKYTLAVTTDDELTVTVGDPGGGVDLTGDLSTPFDLTAGKVGSSVNILDGGELNVLNDGFTSQTTVNSGGDLIVDGGGSADVVTVNFGGDLFVDAGGTATLVKENGGFVFVNDGATVTFVPNSFDGYVYNTLYDYGTIHSGTTGTNLTAANIGRIYVYSGGTATDTTVAADGIFYVSSGGTATDTTVAADGLFYVSSGGTATGIVAEAGAYLMLTAAPGTYAQGTYAGSAFEIVENATDFTVHDKVTLDVLSDGTAADTTVAAGGVFRVYSGGTAVDTTVAADGHLEVWSGGTATGIVAVDGARLELTVAPGTYQKGKYAGSEFEVADTVTDFTVHSGCELRVDGGGTADVVTVNYGGYLGVWFGGKATLVKENGGYVYIDDGATVTFVPNSFDGYVYNTLYDYGTIHSGTTGTNLTAANNGRIYVYSGGIASDTTVNDKGIVEGNSGGLIDGVVVNSGGSLLIYNGAKLTGQMTFMTGAEVIPFVGSILDFDLTQTAPDAAALVNDLSILMGTPGYTLTVAGTEASGTYNLAGGVTSFDKTITVMSPLGDEYGTLTVGGSLSTAFADYTLNLSSGVLTLDLVAKVVVDTTPPVVSNVAADITAPTNGNVTVTADFTDNVAVAYRWFRLDAGAWQDYTTGGVVVDCNTVIDFMAIDTSGNESDVVTCTVTNIDKEPPTITAITPSTTEPAASVTVTATFSDDVGVAYQQFKIGDGAWQDYVDGVVVTENATVYFRAADAAGNVTNASYDVTNIQTLEPDTTKPTVINVAADVTAPTNGSVTVTAEFTDNVAVAYKYYKLVPESLWLDYPDAGVVMPENGTVYFEAVDTSGNVSEVVTFSVTNIDKEAPTITGITPSTTAPAASVTVTATFSDNVALAAQQYKIGGGAWQNYVDGVLVTENALVTFKAVDTAGNETTETYDVTNISSGGGTVVTGDVTEATKDINTGMVASDVNVNVNGVLNIFAGGVASKTTVNTEGSLVVSGGSAVQTSVNAGGEIFVSAGGKADSTTDSGGTIHVYDGASATNTTLISGGVIDICNGGAASSTTAENNGWIRVSAGGVTSDTTVKSGGKLILNGGGKITGKMTFETGAVVSAFENSIVDFNIYPLSPANEALVNNLSIVQGTPKYTLTINGAQMLGTYNLAGGAAAFDQTITVQSILGAEVGTLTVGGGATKIGDVFYTLNLTGSDLTVTVASGGEADTTKPVVTNVVASITTPTNGDVTVTASFYDNVAVASSLYRINSGDWQNYTGGVTVTENATVSFKAVDTSGNESDVVSITVNNIDKTAPEKPTASANVTAPTNGSVNVTAIFAEDSVQNEYSMDGVNWAPYPGLVKFDNNGTVYFRSTDEVGNISEIESYAVTNIDKVPPAKPSASADITTTTSGNVTVTAVFSGDSAKKEFSLDGLVWQDYTAPLVFSANGKAYFRGADAAGNQSDIISYSVTNIQPATPDNAPDDSKNDWVYNKKTKEWNSDANIASFVVNNITAGDSEVRLDKVGSVEKDGKHNFVGRTGSDEDAADYAKIELSKGAALSFSVDSTIAGTFYVYQKTTDKKGNLVATQCQKISVKAGQTSPKKTATIYLEAGEYFVGMEAKLPAAKKGDAAAYYNVNLAGTTFFNDADNGWNNTAYILDGDGKEVKTELNPELVTGALAFGRGATAIQLDTGATGKDGYANWVGFSDATDYRMLTLENAANVTLSLTATGKAKLTIWQVSFKTSAISLKSKGSVSVKADATGLVKSKFLEAGTYFVSVESTDAKKGGSAYYNVSVDSTSVFFDSADTGKNNELYDKKAKAFYPEDKDHHFVTTNVSGAGTSVQLDSDPVKADGYKNFVGYQDKTDYAKINLTTDGNLFFKLKTTGDATFTVYRKGQDKKGNDTLETIQTTKLKLAKGASVIDKFTDVLSGLTAGEYYISMSATNTSTNAKGSVFYNVTATLEPSDAASLAMPETSDSLAMTDALSFGQFDTDALADISSASLSELDDKSAWQNLALA